jgi:microcystin-dependent protein
MAQPYVGEIRMFAGNFAPVGWEICDGEPLPISENETLFQLIGTTYGGDGESTFNLPDLRGRVPIHQKPPPAPAPNHLLGEAAGVEEVTLTTQQMPVHSHPLLAADHVGSQIGPGGALPARSFNVTPYLSSPPDGAMDAAAIAGTGGSQPHTNMQPYLCVNFIISLFGIFPSET